MKKECPWTRDVCRLLTKQNALVLPIVGNRFAPPGWPDRYIAHRKWCGFIEFKGERTVVSPVQRRVIADLRARDVNVWVARDAGCQIVVEDEEGNVVARTSPIGFLDELAKLQLR